MVFTTRLSGGKGGRNRFEHELRAMSREQIVKHVLRAHIDMNRVADAPGLGVH
jgi:hypothetical protein